MTAFLFSALGLLVLAYVGVCLFYWVAQERFIFIRFRLPKDFRFKFRAGHPPHEERWLHPAKEVMLHGLYFKAPMPKGVVLYFHGNTGSLRRWGRRANRFTQCGYDVLMPDPRGYGKSRGRLSEPALHADARSWYEELQKDWPEERIVVYGRSLGAGLATPLAAANRPKALVLETPFANLRDVALHYSALLPYRLLLRYPFRNDRAVVGVRCPVLIMHGRRDNVVPYTSALKLYAAVPTTVHREMVTFPRAHHSDLARFPEYQRKLTEWLS